MNGNPEMEQQIKQMIMPEIDVHDQIMARIQSMKPSRKMINRRLIVAVTALLLLVGTGFVSATFLNLYNENGDIALSIRSFNQDNPKPVLTEELTTKYLDLLMPGEAIAIYNPEGNPQNTVSVLEKPVEITDFERFRQHAGGLFPLPQEWSGRFVFVKGVVHHQLELPDPQGLIRKSQEQYGEVVFEKIRVSPEINGVTMTVSINGDEYLASIYQGGNWETVYTELESAKETKVIRLSGSEALLRLEEDRATFLFRFVNGEQDVFCHFITNANAKDFETNFVALLEQLMTNG